MRYPRHNAAPVKFAAVVICEPSGIMRPVPSAVQSQARQPMRPTNSAELRSRTTEMAEMLWCRRRVDKRDQRGALQR